MTTTTTRRRSRELHVAGVGEAAREDEEIFFLFPVPFCGMFSSFSRWFACDSASTRQSAPSLGQVPLLSNLFQNLQARSACENFEEICSRA